MLKSLFGSRQSTRSIRHRPLRPVEVLEPRLVLSGSGIDGGGGESDGGQASIVNGTVVPQSAYPAVGQVVAEGGCTGTLISPQYVLTAKHCMGAIATFELGDDSYAVSRQIAHPNDDLAILALAEEVEDVLPPKYLDRPPVVGETLTLVGYGNHGTTNDQQPGFGTLREGHTELQFIEDDLIGWVFDGDGESSHSLGDSGGPAFVQRDGELVIAGVASFITGNPNSPGTAGWDVRIDVFSKWIDRTVQTDLLGLSPADFDVDGDVDGRDYLVWQASHKKNDHGDADADGDTDGNDFLIWQTEFGSSIEAGPIGDDGGRSAGGGLSVGPSTIHVSGRTLGSVIRPSLPRLSQIPYRPLQEGSLASAETATDRMVDLSKSPAAGSLSRPDPPSSQDDRGAMVDHVFSDPNAWAADRVASRMSGWGRLRLGRSLADRGQSLTNPGKGLADSDTGLADSDTGLADSDTGLADTI